MKVFISWSGDYSRGVALALHGWLPGVINQVEPFVSAKDVHAGSRWQAEIAKHLEATAFGIVCVTKDNQGAPWLNFEAGALAKAVDSSRVVPLAIDLKPSDIANPLGQFQAQSADEAGIAAMVQSINQATDNPLNEELLGRSVAKWWPDLQEELTSMGKEADAPRKPARPPRSERELLEEVLETVRSMARHVPPSGRSLILDSDSLGEIELMREARDLDPGSWIDVSDDEVVIRFSRPVDRADYSRLLRLRALVRRPVRFVSWDAHAPAQGDS